MIMMFAAFGLSASQDVWESVESKATKRAKIAAQEQKQARELAQQKKQVRQLVAQKKLAALAVAKERAEQERFAKEKAILQEEHEARIRIAKNKREWEQWKKDEPKRNEERRLWAKLQSIATEEYADGDDLVGSRIPFQLKVYEDLKKKGRGSEFDRLFRPFRY
jgi:hypothetical protein